MGRDRLSLSRALHHEQLGEDGNGLQIDGKRPQDFGELKTVVEYQSKEKTRSGEIFDLERIEGWVVGGPTRRQLDSGHRRTRPQTGSGTA